MKRLSIEDYSIYIPARIQCETRRMGVYTLLVGKNLSRAVNNQWKPVLKPLSWIKKEISITDRGNFYPILALFSLSIKEEEDFDIYKQLPEWLESAIRPENIKNLEYSKVRLLIKWGFDINNLIPQGLAVSE